MKHVLSLLGVVALSVSAGATERRPLNVLFIPVDDLKPAIACFGDPYAKTPNLDRIAAKGTVFRRAYCQQAVCSPSRSSLLTGRRPDTTKVYDLLTHFRKALPDVVTLPQHFKDQGYYVRGVGKVYHGGFDDPKSWSAPWEAGSGKNYGPEETQEIQKRVAEAKAKGIDTTQRANRILGPPASDPDVPDDYLNDGTIAARGVELLREAHARKQPFFLAVGFHKPHLPFVAPKKYWDLYDASRLPVFPADAKPPEGAPEYAPQFGGELRNYQGVPKTGPIPPELARRLVHGYYAAVSYMDAQVGRLLDELERLKIAGQTVIVLWGDHGWHLGDHGIWCKHTNYEQATRAALLMSVPGQKAPGQATDALVEFVDIYPTLVEVCGLPTPTGLEGHSFAPLLDDPNRSWKTAAFSQYPRSPGKSRLMGYAVRTDRYRYVEWRHADGRVDAVELYDMERDPGELVNLASKPEHQEIVARHAVILKAGWQENAPPGR